MADEPSGRGVVVAAAVMVIAAQLLAITNDLLLHQSDPSDVVLLAVLIGLAVLQLRRARWARWTTATLVAAGGVLELAAAVLIVATLNAPGFWTATDRAIPALASLHTATLVFVSSQALPLLMGSLLVSAVLDLGAAGMLAFAPSARSYFSRGAGIGGA